MSVSSTPVKKRQMESSDRLEYPLEVRLIAPCKGSESVIALSIYKKKLLHCSHHTAEEILSHDMYLEQ